MCGKKRVHILSLIGRGEWCSNVIDLKFMRITHYLLVKKCLKIILFTMGSNKTYIEKTLKKIQSRVFEIFLVTIFVERTA